jgi:predicted transcriptional regulator of viral defense system
MISMDNLQDQILIRIHQHGSGGVFTPKDFLDLGSRYAVDQALSRLFRQDQLQRLARGLYYFPRINARFNIVVPPDADQIADALGRQTGSRMVPSGAVAANRFGLTTQVPARPVYFTDGNSRQVRIGDMVFQMKHASPRDFPLGSRTSALVFQALRYLGKDAVDDRVVSTIRRALSPRQRAALVRDGRFATDWIAAVIRRIATAEQPEMAHG